MVNYIICVSAVEQRRKRVREMGELYLLNFLLWKLATMHKNSSIKKPYKPITQLQQWGEFANLAVLYSPFPLILYYFEENIRHHVICP